MSTRIEWTDESWNPIVGCEKISPGCSNCYAETMAYRLASMAVIKEDESSLDAYCKVVNFQKKEYKFTWNGKTELNQSQLNKPLKIKGSKRIFVCSMGDLFHKETPIEWIDKVFEVIHLAPQHKYQILTKRDERLREYFQSKSKDWLSKYLTNNIWLGVTIEDQTQAEKRLYNLVRIKGAGNNKVNKFISCEPLISNINFPNYVELPRGYQNIPELPEAKPLLSLIDWVIIGGESGIKARAMNPLWLENIIDQCNKVNTPVFFKQWGEFAPMHSMECTRKDMNGKRRVYFEIDNPVFRIGKKKAGSKLKGIEIKNFPDGL